MQYECEACKDTGEYRGLLTVEPCRECGGKKQPETLHLDLKPLSYDLSPVLHFRCTKDTKIEGYRYKVPDSALAPGGRIQFIPSIIIQQMRMVGYRLEEREAILEAVGSSQPVLAEFIFEEEAQSTTGEIVLRDVVLDRCSSFEPNTADIVYEHRWR